MAQVRCPECGAELPEGSPARLCPRCRATLEESLPDQSDVPTLTTPLPPDEPVSGEPIKTMLPLGRQFGHYQINRLLGKGGMGEVYEAEDLDSGRVVALKVLRERMDSENDHQRFLREGRLAAQVSHPNVVFVFGTEEIDGQQVISMEFAPGGTLEERGPLPVTEGVDAVLQLIAGLEAASSVGVLHRDIKPANCFIDADGRLKIGNFGLSISTLERQQSDRFKGTPAFASPEQVQGRELNIRSDIYSLGVTLFYLLTGKTPFDVTGLNELLKKIVTQEPETPRKHRPELSKSLAAVVLKCLSKEPADRPQDYAELNRLLQPHSSSGLQPGRLGVRFLAGLIDLLLVWGLPFLIVVFVWVFQRVFAIRIPPAGRIIISLWLFVLPISYFALCESLWGSTVGKRLFGLRVIGADGGRPGLVVGIGRACAWFGLLVILPGSFFRFFLGLGIAFSVARSRNGWAGLHELITGTRVVRSASVRHRVAIVTAAAPADTTNWDNLGPFKIRRTRDRHPGQVVEGLDSKLQRMVWLRIVTAETPIVSSARRDLSSPTRLRWLEGRRAEPNSWDAFERPNGETFIQATTQPRSWSTVRRWLLQIVAELGSDSEAPTLPVRLGFNHLWVTEDSRLRILDFPLDLDLPSEEDGYETGQVREVQRLLYEVAHRAKSGTLDRPTGASPWPLHANEFLLTIKNGSFEATEQLLAKLSDLSQFPAYVTQRLRLIQILPCVLWGIMFTIFEFFFFNRGHLARHG